MKKRMDIFGDHSTYCSAGEHTIKRHREIVKMIGVMAKAAGVMFRIDSGDDGTDTRAAIYKNGSSYHQDVAGKVDVTTRKIVQIVYIV